MDPDGLDWLQTTSDFFAGWGDALTFGGTGLVRNWLGANDIVDPNSPAYAAGSIAGAANGFGMGGPAFVRAGQGLKGVYNAWRASREGLRNLNGANSLVAQCALVPRIEIGPHALARMSERGVTQRMVDVALRRGTKYWDPNGKTLVFVLENGLASGKSLVVAVNPLKNLVVTVMRVRKIPSRYLRIP